MPKYSPPENLTREQSEVLEKAAFLIINARNEAAAMLAQAGVPDDGFGFGTPCHAHIDGFGDCPCTKYRGDGEPCLTRITVDPGATPIPHRSCGHPPSKHLST
jgi:hypothetical protein